jgi:perosamine synthetase
MQSPVPHSRPCVGEQEAEAARRVILSGAMAQGPEVEAFEAEMAARLGRRHAVAVASGTVGLQLALAALGVEGRLVAMPSYACTALLHAVWAAGGSPYLCDIDPDSRNLDPQVAEALKQAGVDTVLAVHAFGLPCALEAFSRAGLRVIEDCAMALGAPRVGGGGLLAVCSFYATKVICTGGEGGMVLTDDDKLAGRLRGLRSYDGLPATTTRYNAKLSDVAAAIGRVQLGRLDEFIELRRSWARRYDQAFAGLPLVRPGGEGHMFFRYIIRSKTIRSDLGAAQACQRLAAEGVVARRPVCRPLHLESTEESIEDFPGKLAGQPAAMSAGESMANSQAAWAGDISLPLYPALNEEEGARVVSAVQRLFGQSHG